MNTQELVLNHITEFAKPSEGEAIQIVVFLEQRQENGAVDVYCRYKLHRPADPKSWPVFASVEAHLSPLGRHCFTDLQRVPEPPI